MLITIIIQSVILLFLVVFLIKEIKKNGQINPELSIEYKKKEEELINSQLKHAQLEGEYNSLNKKLEEKESEIKDLKGVIENRDNKLLEMSQLVKEVKLLEQYNIEKNKEIEDLKNNLNSNNKVIQDLKSQNSFLEGENERLKEENKIKKELESRLSQVELENKKNFTELEEKKKNIENLMELQEEIKNQFKVISNEVIKEQKESFNKEQNESLGNLLLPLNRDIKEFKNKIEQVQETNNTNTIKIEENIKHLVNTTNDIGKKADNLATALKGDKKAQGNWGEFQLENLLEMSGLEEGVSFFKQYNVKNENNNNFYIDFLIKLPEERVLIVDSKVSMVNYEKYINANNQEDKNIYLKMYCEDIKKHIKELGGKEYQNIYKEYNKNLANDTPDFVFMFIAVESAYIDAIKFDDSLFQTASDNKVVMVTSSSFMSVLRMIEHLWNIDNQNKYIGEIIDLSKRLYAKVEKFSQDMSKIGDSLDKAKDAYLSARSYISTGKGNILSTANRIINIADIGKSKNQLKIEFEDNE